ncbi:hypothetical protein ASE37_19050 [Rhizobium sp. Root268]|nr:hypothetical protein ASC86_18550 [Rhizobium sp. Root1212]KRD21620.1 hypothetical protein ASE37_19050 [Rhizobium sp. Root268]
MSVPSNTQTNAHLSGACLLNGFNRASLMVYEWWARRAIRKTLGDATDRQLRDAGLIRQDVEDACSLPLLSSAEAAIRAVARKRFANW